MKLTGYGGTPDRNRSKAAHLPSPHPKARPTSSAPCSPLTMTSNTAVAFPSADVLWWNDGSVRVSCPFCTKSHRHGIGHSDCYESETGSRVAHCPPVQPHLYQFSFPFSLKKTAKQHIFIQGMDENGDTTLSYATAERSPSMVALLLDNGAKINTRNRRGRTPLREAAPRAFGEL